MLEKARQLPDELTKIRQIYDEQFERTPDQSPENDKKPEILPNGQELVHRNHWGAYPAMELAGFEKVQLPIRKVRLTHTGANSCSDLRSCKIRVARIQLDHMFHHGLQDIAFNFLIGPDGRVYEGRGWEIQAERDEKLDHLGDNCFDIAFIGRHKWEPPPPIMLKTCRKFLKFCEELEFFDKNYELITRYEHFRNTGDEEQEKPFEEILAEERQRAYERRMKARELELATPDYYSLYT